MFKTSFAKHLSAFVIIIFVSFVILSGVITAIIQRDITNEKKKSLDRISAYIAAEIERDSPADFKSHVTENGGANFEDVILNLIEYDQQLNIIITDADGKILLTTGQNSEDEDKKLTIPDENALPPINISDYRHDIMLGCFSFDRVW